jgi:hypothetical protein
MANNCLVTRLKGVVNNDELPYFNSLKINYSSGYAANNRVIALYTDRGSYRIISEHPVDVYDSKILLAEGVMDFTTPKIVNDALHIKFPDNNGICNVISKHTINTIGYNWKHPILGTRSGYTSFQIEASQLDYSETFREFRCFGRNLRGDYRPMHAETLTYVMINNLSGDRYYDFTTDISCFANSTDATTIDLKGGENITGNLETLSRLTKLTNLTLWGSGVAGDIKILCENLVENGKTSGEITFDCQTTGGNRTWDSNTLSYDYVKSLNNGGSTAILKVAFGSSYTGGFQIVPTA